MLSSSYKRYLTKDLLVVDFKHVFDVQAYLQFLGGDQWCLNLVSAYLHKCNYTFSNI